MIHCSKYAYSHFHSPSVKLLLILAKALSRIMGGQWGQSTTTNCPTLLPLRIRLHTTPRHSLLAGGMAVGCCAGRHAHPTVMCCSQRVLPTSPCLLPLQHPIAIYATSPPNEGRGTRAALAGCSMWPQSRAYTSCPHPSWHVTVACPAPPDGHVPCPTHPTVIGHASAWPVPSVWSTA